MGIAVPRPRSAVAGSFVGTLRIGFGVFDSERDYRLGYTSEGGAGSFVGSQLCGSSSGFKNRTLTIGSGHALKMDTFSNG